ncbi:MAG: bifunctional diaminohydroxyphosphoribosylaminopyrimidine deaminase/5-amino-6-(5-phosphoribosylamino)uracil reductase RibD [Planctomycetota bacterium]|nr:MAG: bifunctional diaminohydroxyphosphoribosylaminopyrimidine deaminase/5-amino-6-(5-phosphoribosylamino)uracil reductase RibD [Planctomycetota bacterium]
MLRAVELAARGLGRVEPNPPVGAVCVREGRVVGEGWHERFGGPHAERRALEAAGGAARGATLYVTLEPCAHHGKTPPCTDAILAAGCRRVVYACADPNPEAAGGARRLEAAGVEVAHRPLPEAERLLAPFLVRVREGRPWVIAKWAMSLDGRIATRTGHARWISGELSRQRVHERRAQVDAVLVGIGTALADDPLLTVRLPAGHRVAGATGRPPLRVVVDTRARLPLTSRLVASAREAPVLVAVGRQAPAPARAALQAAGCEVLEVGGGRRAGRSRCAAAGARASGRGRRARASRRSAHPVARHARAGGGGRGDPRLAVRREARRRARGLRGAEGGGRPRRPGAGGRAWGGAHGRGAAARGARDRAARRGPLAARTARAAGGGRAGLRLIVRRLRVRSLALLEDQDRPVPFAGTAASKAPRTARSSARDHSTSSGGGRSS